MVPLAPTPREMSLHFSGFLWVSTTLINCLELWDPKLLCGSRSHLQHASRPRGDKPQEMSTRRDSSGMATALSHVCPTSSAAGSSGQRRCSERSLEPIFLPAHCPVPSWKQHRVPTSVSLFTGGGRRQAAARGWGRRCPAVPKRCPRAGLDVGSVSFPL